MIGITLSNDPLSDKRFDFQFVNPPYGYEWSKDFDAVISREPRQSDPHVCQRLGQRGIKPETLPPLIPSSFSRFTFQRGQLGDISIYGKHKRARRQRLLGLATQSRRVTLRRQQPKEGNLTTRCLKP